MNISPSLIVYNFCFTEERKALGFGRHEVE